MEEASFRRYLMFFRTKDVSLGTKSLPIYWKRRITECPNLGLGYSYLEAGTASMFLNLKLHTRLNSLGQQAQKST